MTDELTPPPNPYAPGRVEAHARPEKRAPGTWVTRAYVCVAAANLGGTLPFEIMKRLGVSSESLAWTVTASVFAPIGLVQVALGFSWVYQEWRGLPALLDRCAPRAAVARFFIPLFGFYWLFAVQTHLCDALDIGLINADATPRAPRVLSRLAPLVALATLPLFRVTHNLAYMSAVRWGSTLLWAAYALTFDVARRALARAHAEEPRL